MPVTSAVRALPASPPLISLLTSAEIIPEGDNRWEAGITFENEVCGGDRTGSFAACDVSGVTSTPGSDTTELEPVIIWAADSCSPLGAASRDWVARARRKLAACESDLIENELWRGDVGRTQVGWPNKYLASVGTEEVTAAADDPISVLACLENALANCNCGQQGMIHATRQVVTHWVAANLVIRDGNKLLTQLGTIVVPGSGYDGSGPGDPPAPATTTVWAYATSMIHIRLGPVVVLPSDQSQAMDRAANTLTYWAQRVAIVGFDCCQFAGEIDMAACAVSGS